ncbi:MAG TPA: response regulator transcription factor [Noviherbaspirillum sp.]|jgi:DNA-binding response OmpR family regulator|uniref:response regulator transcription factor n=1 Tax=Noviherbaspirillum sp. TaxID=1926288 RepID=UPI002F95E8A2
MRIAILTRDSSDAGLIGDVLRAAGHACEVHDEAGIPAALDADACDLLVAGLPLSGKLIDALQRRRHEGRPLPLLVVGTRADEDALFAALASGADDYLFEPVRRRELAIRVKLLLRRFHPAPDREHLQSFGAYAFDPTSRQATKNGAAIDLTQKEFDLALLFFRHLGRPLSRAFIQEAVWPGQQEMDGRSIDTHVSRVRTKLGLRPENGLRLLPVYSYGYRLEQLAA